MIRLESKSLRFDSIFYKFYVKDSIIKDSHFTPQNGINNLGDSGCVHLQLATGIKCQTDAYNAYFLVTPQICYPQVYSGSIGFNLFLSGPIKMDSLNRSINSQISESKVLKKVELNGASFYLADFLDPTNFSPTYFNEVEYLEQVGLVVNILESHAQIFHKSETIKLERFNGNEIILIQK